MILSVSDYSLIVDKNNGAYSEKYPSKFYDVISKLCDGASIAYDNKIKFITFHTVDDDKVIVNVDADKAVTKTELLVAMERARIMFCAWCSKVTMNTNHTKIDKELGRDNNEEFHESYNCTGI